MYQTDGKVFVEEDDQCNSCENFAKGVSCPLLQALAFGMVVMEDSLIVTNCGFYKKFERRLKILGEDQEEKPAPTAEIKTFKRKK